VVAEGRSETFSLGPWEIKTVHSYIETDGLSPGKYDVRTTVHYLDKSASKEFKEGFIIQPGPMTYQTPLIYLVVIIILVVLSIVLFIKKHSDEKKKK
jgi:hypothetical protein